MRSEMIRLYKGVHTWTGILTGMALFIAFYAGALTIFKAPLNGWAEPPAVRASLALDEAARLVEQVVAMGVTDFTLHLQQNPQRPWPLTWQPRGESEQQYARFDEAGLLETGREQPTAVGELVDLLHQTAGLVPGDLESGITLMGVVSLFYGLALISGVVVLLPTLVKDFFAVRPGRNRKRFWLDSHNVLGIISLPFHLVILLSALVFAFHDPIYELQDRLVYGGNLQQHWDAGGPLAGLERGPEPAPMLSPQRLLAHARQAAPHFEPHTLTYLHAGKRGASVIVRGLDERYPQRTVEGGLLVLVAATGATLNDSYVPGQGPVWDSLISLFFALHFASFGGYWVDWGYFLLGLAGAALFYTGNLLWIETRRRRARQAGQQPEQTRTSRILGALSVGVCLGCVTGISLSLASAKWLHGWGLPSQNWHITAYYLVFLACVGWALWRGAARAAVDLLGLAALATLLIPLASLLAWFWPDCPWWVHRDWTSLAVDLVALLGAGLLAGLARFTARRLCAAAPDGIWTLATTSPGSRGEVAR